MLHWRLLLGTLFVATVVLLCWLDTRAAVPGTYLFPLAMVITLAASQEIVRLLRPRSGVIHGRLVYVGNVVILASAAIPLLWSESPLGSAGWPLLALTLVMLAAFLQEISAYHQAGTVLERMGRTMLALCYVGLLMSFLVLVRLLGTPLGSAGMPLLAAVIATVKLCDTGAYTFGRLFGRHKLIPRLSPGKTIEGAIGGIVCGSLGAMAVLSWLLPPGETPLPWWASLAFGLIISVVGIYGDLAESLIKRDSGHKDSSEWMPGFGGVLDVMDSILAAAPVTYLLWILWEAAA